MGYEVARKVITGYFKTGFKKPDTTDWLPVEYPNRALEDDKKTGKTATAWARFTIVHGRKFAREVGTGSSRTPGVVYLQIFLKEDSGTLLARQIADHLVGQFENVHLQTDTGIIRFRSVSSRELPAENGWDRTNIEMPFERDEQNAAASAQAAFVVPYTP